MMASELLMTTSDKKKVRDKPLYYDIHGLILTAPFDPDLFRSALNYKPGQDDIFIATFPKAGTTWMQTICYMLCNEGKQPKPADILTRVPFLEMLGEEGVLRCRDARPTLIKTHLAFDLCPFSPVAKYIVVIRNPKDVFVSFLHHTRAFPGYYFEKGSIEEFFEIFIRGENDFGDYFDHLKSWYAQRAKPNILIILYEQLKLDPTSNILKIAQFIGVGDEVLANGGELLKDVITGSDINQMKEAYDNFSLLSDLKVDGYVSPGLKAFQEVSKNAAGEKTHFDTFVRKGMIGDWLNHLTSDMSKQIDKKIAEKLQPVEEYRDILDLWKNCNVIQHF